MVRRECVSCEWCKSPVAAMLLNLFEGLLSAGGKDDD